MTSVTEKVQSGSVERVKQGEMSNLGGRIMGALAFLGGIALIALVFYNAYGLFSASPSHALGLTFTGDPKKDPTLALVGARFGWLFFRVAILLIMAFSGSLIAQKGINLYLCALQQSAKIKHDA